MCGIAGVIDLRHSRNVDLTLLQRMGDAMVHRGPDEVGLSRKPGIGLISRRLSIVGVEDGQQPITNETRDVTVVLNGEIYDYADHRANLNRKGHQLKTDCDTELLPHMWEDDGLDMFRKINGQFGVAILDERQKRFVLARDRVGICPLHWTRSSRLGPDWLLFASEIKALLATGLMDVESDPVGVDTVFNFLAIPGPNSCFKGINILQPGSYLEVELSTDQPNPIERRYWSLDFPDRGDEYNGTSEAALIDEFEDLLLTAVKRRLVADVPVASYLSAGVDSSLVTAMAAHALGSAPPTFTTRIVDPKLDESAGARSFAKTLNAEPVVVPCGEDTIINNYQRLLISAEAPVVDTSCVALMLLAERVNQEGLKVVLTGEGCDEWLGGYQWFRAGKIFDTLDAVSSGVGGTIARAGMARWLGKGAADVAYEDACNQAAGGRNAFHDFYSVLNANRFRLYSKQMHERLDGRNHYEALQPDVERIKKWHPMNRTIYWGAQVFLPGHLLSLKGDRIAMQNSVETRYPFLDNDVVDFMSKLDPVWKIRKGRAKYLLRKVAERWMPKEVAWRPKRMLRAPMNGFLMNSNSQYVDQLLSKQSVQKSGYFDHAAIENWRARYHRTPNIGYKRSSIELGLTAAIATQLWHHTFVDPTLADLPAYTTERAPAPMAQSDQPLQVVA